MSTEARRITVAQAKTALMPEWRLTRPGIYHEGCQGYADVSARQGYYVRAWSAEDAVTKLAKEFPSDVAFDVQPWGHNAAERVAQIRYLDAKAAVAAVQASDE